MEWTASTFADSFETLLEAYEKIGEQLPCLEEYNALFHNNAYMIDALELMYIDILEFHQQAMRFFSGKRMCHLNNLDSTRSYSTSLDTIFQIHVERLWN